jgi:hypothetical protein
MTRRKTYLIGLAAPFIFILTVILGGALRPGYSHMTDMMSELFSPGSPNRLLLSGLYTLFGIALSAFGYGLLRFVQDDGRFTRIGGSGAVAFIAVGVLSILSATLFPQDPWGSIPTLRGQLHIALHGIISILSLIYMVLFGFWFRRTGIAQTFFVYSMVTVVGAAIGAGWFMASYGGPLMGLSERVAALVGFQWTSLLAITVLKNDLEFPLREKSASNG